MKITTSSRKNSIALFSDIAGSNKSGHKFEIFDTALFFFLKLFEGSHEKKFNMADLFRLTKNEKFLRTLSAFNDYM